MSNMSFCWAIADGTVYVSDTQTFISRHDAEVKGYTVTPLFTDNSVPADRAFLAKTLRFYDLPVPAELLSRVERGALVQQEYEPQLSALALLHTTATMDGDLDMAAELVAEYKEVKAAFEKRMAEVYK